MSILRKKREAMGLTLVEAASRVGVDPGNLHRIETGKQVPRIERAKRIAEFYGVALIAVLAPEDQAA